MLALTWAALPSALAGPDAGAPRAQPIRVAGNPHWLEFRGRPILLAGDSITQGWMELGTHFDQQAYVDALARRGINALLLWSYIGILDQRADARIGYDAPALWPWEQTEGRFDLTRFNDAYFARLRDLVSAANSREIVVVITVHDGWPKTRFAGHPFNAVNGGPLEERSQYVELHDYRGEMPARFDSGWTRPQKHQYYLERFCGRLLRTTADLPNVMYEIFNEGEWYDPEKLRAFQVHFLEFFKARTSRPLVINEDHVRGPGFRGEPKADVLSHHKPRWDDGPGAEVFFRHYQAQFSGTPARPFFFSEPVPVYDGDASRHQAVMRLLWGTALAGAGVVMQNDASWGFDPRSAMAARAAERDTVLDLEGHLARFFNGSGVCFARMQPDGSMSSTGLCLAEPGVEYVVYSQESRSPFTVDLSGAAGKTLRVRWYDPRTGAFKDAAPVSGQGKVAFTPPLEGDAVLHLSTWLDRPRALEGPPPLRREVPAGLGAGRDVDPGSSRQELITGERIWQCIL